MKSKLEERINSLKSEYENGQKMLAEIDAKRKSVRDTLLRIEGAMAVLKELSEEEAKAEQTNGSAGARSVESPPAAALS